MLKTCYKKGALGLTELQTTGLKLRGGMRGNEPLYRTAMLVETAQAQVQGTGLGPVLKPQNNQDTLSVLLGDLEDIRLGTNV